MDHLARIAMKNAANCVKYGELQGFRNRYMSNAYCGPVIHLTGPRLSEGLLNFNKRFAAAMSTVVAVVYWASPRAAWVLLSEQSLMKQDGSKWRVLPVHSHRGVLQRDAP